MAPPPKAVPKSSPKQPVKISKEFAEEDKKDGRIKIPKIKIFLETAEGPTFSLKVPVDCTIGEVKRRLCKVHGHLMDRHWLQNQQGIQLEDLCSLRHYAIKEGTTVLLGSKGMEGLHRLGWKKAWEKDFAESELSVDEVAARKADLLRSQSELKEQQELASRPFMRASDEDLEDAVVSKLKKALTSGGLHANEHFDFKKPGRQAARRLAMEQATKHMDAKMGNNAQEDLISVVSGAVLQLFPNLLVGCNPTLAKKHAPMGGA